MKHQPGPMVAQAAMPTPPDVALPAGTGPLAWYDQIRALLIQTGLPPEPAVYDVLWRYVRDEDAELSLAIDKALAGDGLTLGTVMSLRETLLGQMSEAQVNQLIAQAHGQAEALTKRIESRPAPIWPIMAAPLPMAASAWPGRSMPPHWLACSNN
jgi:diguanylate cyclase